MTYAWTINKKKDRVDGSNASQMMPATIQNYRRKSKCLWTIHTLED